LAKDYHELTVGVLAGSVGSYTCQCSTNTVLASARGMGQTGQPTTGLLENKAVLVIQPCMVSCQLEPTYRLMSIINQ